MGCLTCPLPRNSNTQESDTHSQSRNSDINSISSSSNASLSSQPSLPSVPSLTPPHPPSTHHRCIATLKGHSSYTFSIALAGKHLYSGSSNSEIRLWPKQPNNYNYSLSDNNVVARTNSAVKSLLVLGDKLISAHQDHKIRVWKINELHDGTNCIINGSHSHHQYKCISTLPTLHDRVAKLFLAKNYVEIRRHKTCTWVHHVDTVSALALSTDKSLLYSASWDRTFKVWRTSDFKCLESVWNAHDDAINAITISEDGLVYTGSADRKIKVWKKKMGEKKHTLLDTLEKHKSSVNALALSTDGSILYSGACDRSIIVWEKDGGAGGDGSGGGGHMVVAGALRGHNKAILCLGVVGDIVCSGSADKTVRIWRRGNDMEKSYSCLGVLVGHEGPVKCLAATVEDGPKDIELKSGTNGCYLKVYSGSLDCDVKVWQVCVPLL